MSTAERRTVMRLVLAPLLFLGFAASPPAHAQDDALPSYLRDRGTGITTSMFGTYIRPRELLVYPFYEYYGNSDYEYKPSELGYVLEEDFRGDYRASEGLIYLGYGINDRLMAEVEASLITATLDKAPDDPSGLPATIEQSGIGTLEGQLRYHWNRESEGTPEFFTYGTWVAPTEKDQVLIATPDWEFKLGTGAIKGFSIGTFTASVALDYTLENATLDLGTYALEYLRRLSPAWRVFLSVEGSQDEVEMITDVQWHMNDWSFFRFNNAFGLTSKANDWAPEIGIVFSFFPNGR